MTNISQKQISEIKNRYDFVLVLNAAISDLILHKNISKSDKFTQLDSFLERKEDFVLNLVGFAADFQKDGYLKYFKMYLELCRNEIEAIKKRNYDEFLNYWISDREQIMTLKKLIDY
jgi:hypothetical protein